ncbi:MAG: mannose-1-phosphate guanyltransferase [Candidatus Margulisbacteria bacterium]|nr:mannose-1-phosphate guanyltransferase [Candidatus Margulisiibacteriota bacterium]MBU1617020.1 mannose-1-phosphate guanyltransferase [Candidatus Margulisiibacteriota bacterium]
MKAIVLAGGLGTRLHPLTVNIPKPMVPVANRPLMQFTMELLKQNDFDDVTALLYHQPEVIKKYFGNGSKFGQKISYIEAKDDYGTAGAVRLAAVDVKETFLVMSSDVLSDFDLKAAVAYHKEKHAQVTIVLTRVPNPLQYGIVILNSDGSVKYFLEKPSWSEIFSDTVNCGMYIIEPEIVSLIPAGRSFDFSLDLFPLLLSKKVPIFGYIAAGNWRDIGSVDEYSRASSAVLKVGEKRIDKEAKLAATVKLAGKIVVGAGSFVADNVVLENVTLGRGNQIGRDTVLRDVILWDNVTIGNEVNANRSIIGQGTIVGERSLIEEGVVIGDECNLGKEVVVKPYVKIWPKKVVEEGVIVSRSMVWRERWTKGLFGPFGVNGLCNVEITPEFAATLGTAYATLLGKGAQISTSRDSHPASRMIYRALLSGVLSAGVNVSDLEMIPIPVNRYELKALKSRGGFHVRKSPYDNNVIDIKFFDENGMDLSSTSEKKIERLFFSEEFSRADISEVGELSFPFHRVTEYYKGGLVSLIDRDLIRQAKMKVVVDYAYSSASQIFPSILGDLGIEVIAINAYIDETKITKSKTMFEKGLAELSQIVKSLKADLGIMLDTGAEKVFLCDESGRILDGDLELAIMTVLVCRGRRGGQIAVPVKASRVIDQLAAKYEAKVVRTRVSVRSMMERCHKGSTYFFGETQGGFIFPEFQCAFDAMFSSVRLIELLARNKTRLSAIAEEVPNICMHSKEISCAAENKGKVLRSIIDSIGNAEVDLTDGVKVFHGEDWVLILPDPIRPVIHIYAESDRDDKARKLVDQYVERIDSII